MLRRIEQAAALSSVATAELSLRELFALCEVAHSMVSVDTGPAHAAAALGLPLVVLYGAESPRYWLPRSPSGSPVIGLGGPPAATRVSQIPPDAVLDAWHTVAQGAHSRSTVQRRYVATDTGGFSLDTPKARQL
jgi:ADP-heptose:LPS heptosyltransferase